jgi:hypothetical protein
MMCMVSPEEQAESKPVNMMIGNKTGGKGYIIL